MNRIPETIVGKIFGGLGDLIYYFAIIGLLMLAIYIVVGILKAFVNYLEKEIKQKYRKLRGMQTYEEEELERKRNGAIEANIYHKERLLDDFIKTHSDIDTPGYYSLRDHWFNSYEVKTEKGILDVLNKVETGQIKFQEIISTMPLRLQDIEKIYFKK